MTTPTGCNSCHTHDTPIVTAGTNTLCLVCGARTVGPAVGDEREEG